jgi:hypothetical protein
MTQKQCTTCKSSKTTDLFYKNRCKKDGLANVCKMCQHDYETKYVNNNKKKVQARKTKYIKNRRNSDDNFKLAHALRRRINSAVKRNQKGGSAVEQLGCSIPFLKQYIESKFQRGMNWSNYSYHGWHIDHIIPLSSFNLSDPEQFKIACNYANLQPLWRKDNQSKGDKLDKQS